MKKRKIYLKDQDEYLTIIDYINKYGNKRVEISYLDTIIDIPNKTAYEILDVLNDVMLTGAELNCLDMDYVENDEIKSTLKEIIEAVKNNTDLSCEKFEFYNYYILINKYKDADNEYTYVDAKIYDEDDIEVTCKTITDYNDVIDDGQLSYEASFDRWEFIYRRIYLKLLKLIEQDD